MLVSAVSMNGVVPAIKKPKQSSSNYASNVSTLHNDTSQKSGMSFEGWIVKVNIINMKK